MKIKTVWVSHVVCWVLFITYEISVIAILTGKTFPTIDYLLSYAVNIILFYFSGHVVMPTLNENKFKSFWLFPTLLISEICGYLLLMTAINKLGLFIDSKKFNIFSYDKSSLLRSLWRGIYFIMLSVAYWFGFRNAAQKKHINDLKIENLHSRLEKTKLERNIVKTENAYLRSQINPHLLFNILNFLYSSLYDLSQDAARCVILLADIMSYSLAKLNEDGKVGLNEEIKQIKNLIELNQLRFKHKLYLNLAIEADEEQGQIIPLVLVTFVENIFMHGELTDKNNQAQVSIINNDKGLQYKSVNKKKVEISLGNGIGIKNACMRLETYYSGHYSLYIDDSDDFYVVNLQITL